MAGKHLSSSSSFARERPLYTSHLFLLILSLLSLLLLIFYVSSFSSTSPSLVARSTLRNMNPNPNVEYSSVASLEQFLTNKLPQLRKMAAKDDTVSAANDECVTRLDDLIWRTEIDRLYQDSFFPVSDLPLRVYVYEMSDKFTYDLLWLFRNSYKETDNLTSNGSHVHRLIEQEALKWVTDQPAWKRSEGRDHIIPVHHPWSFKSVHRYVKNAVWLLPDMDSTGNWYKPGQVYLEKDLILPYVANVDFCDAQCVKENQSKRKTLLFFRGRLKRNAGGKIRSKLVAELVNAEGVVIAEGIDGVAGKVAAQQGMRKSTFCLSPAGDTPSSARLFDAIVNGCIPVIVSDELELPFEGIID